MRLESLHVRNFGCVRDCPLALDPARLNLVLAPNEAGKSTLLDALQTVLYGFPKKTTSEGRDLRQRFRPWAGGAGRITLALRHGGHAIGIDFDVSDAANEPVERFTVHRDGIDVTDQMTAAAATPGEWLLGLSRTDFRRSVLVRQGELDAVADEIGGLVRHLEQVITSSSETESASAAVARLNEALAEYRAAASLEHLAGGVLARARTAAKARVQLDARLAVLQSEDAALQQERAALAGAIARLEADDELIARLEQAHGWLIVLHHDLQLRQERNQLEQEDRRRRDVAQLDRQLARDADLASFPRTDTARLAGLVERHAAQRERLDAAQAAAAAAHARRGQIDAERDSLAAVAPLTKALGGLENDLALFRECRRRRDDAARRGAQVRRRLIEEGVPLDRLAAARRRAEKMQPAERELLRTTPAKRLDLESARRRGADEVREAQETLRLVDDSRRRRRMVGLGLMAAAIILGAAAAFFLHWAAGLAVVLGAASPGAWVYLSGRQAQAYRRDQAAGAVARGEQQGRDAAQQEADLAAALERIAARLGVTAPALLEELDLLHEHAARLADADATIRVTAERGGELTDHEARWRARLETAGERAAEGSLDVAAAEVLLDRVRRRASLDRESEAAAAESARHELESRAARTQLLDAQAQIAEILDRGGAPAEGFQAGTPATAAAIAAAEGAFRRRAAAADGVATAQERRRFLAGEALGDDEIARKRQRIAKLESMRSAAAATAALGAPERAAASLAALAEAGLGEFDVSSWAPAPGAMTPEQALEERRRVECEQRALRDRRQTEGGAVREFLERCGRRLPEIERERGTLAAELERCRSFTEAVGIAMSTLEEVQADSYERWSGLLRGQLGDLLSGLLPGYRLDAVRRDLNIEIIQEATGQRLDLEQIGRHLSRGAKDRFYLAVRMALGRVLGAGRDDPLPLVLDDPLANCDDERFAESLALLGAACTGGASILLFTCQSSRCRDALRAMPPGEAGAFALHELPAAGATPPPREPPLIEVKPPDTRAETSRT